MSAGLPVSPSWRHREIVTVLLIGVLSVVLWRVPVLGWLLYPFQLYTTFVHELCHGLAAILTGGEFRRFAVNPDLSGLAWSAGGWRWVVTSAGYIGSALFGGALALLSARGVPASPVLRLLGAALAFLCILFVRNVFGIVSGLALAALLYVAGQRLNRRYADALLLLLAVQMMTNGLDSLLDLVRLSAASNTVSDAQIMAEQTGVPAVVWAFIWTAFTLASLFWTLRAAYRRA
jgi:hypothetical protein